MNVEPPNPGAAWHDHEDPDWLRRFLGAGDTKQKVGDWNVRFTGACPRCGHTIDIDIPIPPSDIDFLSTDLVIAGEDDKPKASPPADGRMPCNCVEGKKSHDGRTAGDPETGCGVYAYAYI